MEVYCLLSLPDCKMIERSDTELVALSLTGQKEAFSELFRRYHKTIYWLVLGYTKNPDVSDDLTQETFILAYRNLINLRNHAAFFCWLETIARNRCKRWQRDYKKVSSLDHVNEPESYDPSQRPSETSTILQDATSILSREEKLVLALKYQGGLHCNEIAKTLGKPIGTVSSLLSRAYSKLKAEVTRIKEKKL